MTEELSPESDDADNTKIDEDLELVVNYLQGRLDPARHEAVRKRLEEDEAFHYLAEPLLIAWSIPKHLERHPRPKGEWERAWAEFKRRAGIEQRDDLDAAAGGGDVSSQ
jgi:hypothetical protein